MYLLPDNYFWIINDICFLLYALRLSWGVMISVGVNWALNELWEADLKPGENPGGLDQVSAIEYGKWSNSRPSLETGFPIEWACEGQSGVQNSSKLWPNYEGTRQLRWGKCGCSRYLEGKTRVQFWTGWILKIWSYRVAVSTEFLWVSVGGQGPSPSLWM
jgi:hypothetical protein